MPHHAQRLRRMACNQDAFPLRQQMTNQVANGVRLASPRRALHQDASVFLKLLRNAYLFGVSGFAEQHFSFSLKGGIRGLLNAGVRGRRFFSDNIEERPRQIFSRAEISENSLDRRSESQSSRSQKENRLTSDLRVGRSRLWCAIFQKFAARRELNHQPLQERGSGPVHQRMKAFLFEFFSATTNRAAVDIIHRLE